jgi:hypothetical protein
MNKICLIIPWYGKIPDFFSIYLKSLAFNSEVLDVLFFTDEQVSFATPENFKRIELSWDDLVLRIKDRVSAKSNLKTSYKLCDFRPMYAKIFQEEIAAYDYWGYGDIDLIYGDLQKFLPWNGIENYDVITFRENIVHGPFSIFKNTPAMRELYLKTNKLDYLVSEEEYIGFDESARKKPWRSRERLYNFLDLDNWWDWSCIIQKEADTGKLKLFERYYCLEWINGDADLQYKDGQVKIGMEDYAFFHWVAHKRVAKFVIPSWTKVPDVFYINSTGFYKSLEFGVSIKKFSREFFGGLINIKRRVKLSYSYRFSKKV